MPFLSSSSERVKPSGSSDSSQLQNTLSLPDLSSIFAEYFLPDVALGSLVVLKVGASAIVPVNSTLVVVLSVSVRVTVAVNSPLLLPGLLRLSA